jgi:hypothetical protein
MRSGLGQRPWLSVDAESQQAAAASVARPLTLERRPEVVADLQLGDAVDLPGVRPQSPTNSRPCAASADHLAARPGRPGHRRSSRGTRVAGSAQARACRRA